MTLVTLYTSSIVLRTGLSTSLYVLTYLTFLLGQPIAWCLSDPEDAVVVEAFLQAVKGRAAGCRVQVVMTDDGEWQYITQVDM